MQYQELNNWLGREDSNLRVAESKSAALPLGYAPTPLFSRAAARGARTIMRGGISRNRAVGGHNPRWDFYNARTVGRGQPSRHFSVARQKSCPLAPEIVPIGRNQGDVVQPLKQAASPRSFLARGCSEYVHGAVGMTRLVRGLADLASGYKVILSDVWGVVHNGTRGVRESHRRA